MDWIKWVVGLEQTPQVISMAEQLKIAPEEVAARCMMVWAWAQRVTRDGNVASVTPKHVDGPAGLTGFGAELVRVGWLSQTDSGIEFTNWQEHNSQGAKTRALTSRRVKKHRGKPPPKSNAVSVTNVTPDALTDKRREELNNPPNPPSQAKGGLSGRAARRQARKAEREAKKKAELDAKCEAEWKRLQQRKRRGESK